MRAELVEKVKQAFPQVTHEVSLDFNVFIVDPKDYQNLASFLKNEPDLYFDHLSDLSAVDYLEYLEVVCHLYSYKHKHKCRLKTKVSPDNPEVDSLTSLWATANWHEREAYDLYGVKFKGHPDLRRILSDETQPGHPFRKNVPLENDEEWLLSDDEPLETYGIPKTWEW